MSAKIVTILMLGFLASGSTSVHAGEIGQWLDDGQDPSMVGTKVGWGAGTTVFLSTLIGGTIALDRAGDTAPHSQSVANTKTIVQKAEYPLREHEKEIQRQMELVSAQIRRDLPKDVQGHKVKLEELEKELRKTQAKISEVEPFMRTGAMGKYLVEEDRRKIRIYSHQYHNAMTDELAGAKRLEKVALKRQKIMGRMVYGFLGVLPSILVSKSLVDEAINTDREEKAQAEQDAAVEEAMRRADAVGGARAQ